MMSSRMISLGSAALRSVSILLLAGATTIASLRFEDRALSNPWAHFIENIHNVPDRIGNDGAVPAILSQSRVQRDWQIRIKTTTEADLTHETTQIYNADLSIQNKINTFSTTNDSVSSIDRALPEEKTVNSSYLLPNVVSEPNVVQTSPKFDVNEETLHLQEMVKETGSGTGVVNKLDEGSIQSDSEEELPLLSENENLDLNISYQEENTTQPITESETSLFLSSGNENIDLNTMNETLNRNISYTEENITRPFHASEDYLILSSVNEDYEGNISYPEENITQPITESEDNLLLSSMNENLDGNISEENITQPITESENDLLLTSMNEYLDLNISYPDENTTQPITESENDLLWSSRNEYLDINISNPDENTTQPITDSENNLSSPTDIIRMTTDETIDTEQNSYQSTTREESGGFGEEGNSPLETTTLTLISSSTILDASYSQEGNTSGLRTLLPEENDAIEPVVTDEYEKVGETTTSHPTSLTVVADSSISHENDIDNSGEASHTTSTKLPSTEPPPVERNSNELEVTELTSPTESTLMVESSNLGNGYYPRMTSLRPASSDTTDYDNTEATKSVTIPKSSVVADEKFEDIYPAYDEYSDYYYEAFNFHDLPPPPPPCTTDLCVRKCCPPGKILSYFPPELGCIDPTEHDLEWWIPPFRDRGGRPVEPQVEPTVMAGEMDCDYSPVDPQQEHYLLPSGHLYNSETQREYDYSSYCMEVVKHEEFQSQLELITCFEAAVPGTYYQFRQAVMPVLMILSILALAVLVILFCLVPVPEFRNLQGRCRISHAVCLMLSSSLTVSTIISPLPLPFRPCVAVGLLVHVLFIAAFLWLTVLCYDIWRAFGGSEAMASRQTRHSETRYFLKYCLFAWGGALLLGVVSLTLQLLSDDALPTWVIRPDYGRTRCYIHDDTPQLLVYYFGIAACLFIANLFFMSHTASFLYRKGIAFQCLKRLCVNKFALRHDSATDFGLQSEESVQGNNLRENIRHFSFWDLVLNNSEKKKEEQRKVSTISLELTSTTTLNTMVGSIHRISEEEDPAASGSDEEDVIPKNVVKCTINNLDNVQLRQHGFNYLEDFWQRFQLFALMALCWTTEVLSWLIPPQEMWVLTDMINASQGCLLLALYLRNKKLRVKIREALKERIESCRRQCCCSRT